MRTTSTALIFALTFSASACKWPADAPNPIEQNVTIARYCMAIVVVTLCSSLLHAIHRRNHYWAPIVLALFLALEIGLLPTARYGDCGFTVVTWAEMSVPLSLIALGGQRLAAHREDQIKNR